MTLHRRHRSARAVLAALISGVALGAVVVALTWIFWLRHSHEAPAATADDQSKSIANSFEMKFVLIPKGTFLMGSPATEEHREADETQHQVTLTKDFYLGVHEVTQGQYERIMKRNPSYFTPTGLGKAKVRARETSQSPVENVTWHEAVEFCNKLGELPAEKEAKRSYRLPTEAEWEYACRAGTKSALHYGDIVNSYKANFNGLSPYGPAGGGPFHRTTWRVGEYPANSFGLYDMHGNVMEWCQDWYAVDYYEKSPKVDPPGPDTGTLRVTRGGSWSNSGKACRSAVRTKLAPDDSHYGLGFRVVLVQEK